MEAPSTGMKAGAAAAFVALVTGIVYFHSITPNVERGGDRVSIEWPDGGAPEGVRCLFTEALASPQALGIFHLAHDGGSRYIFARQCAVPLVDGGSPGLPGGMDTLDYSQEEGEYDGGPQFWAVTQGQPEFECACSSGIDAGCERFALRFGTNPRDIQVREWQPAAPGDTMAKGTWRGAGCVPKPCVEFAGASSWPMECPR